MKKSQLPQMLNLLQMEENYGDNIANHAMVQKEWVMDLKASQLKTEPGDFSKADVQSQSDGSIFYKSSEGRDDMPSFKKKIPDADDRWSLVNYIRTFKKIIS